jgi:hypothetical protein
MVTILSLWLPILLSAVFVFVVSSVIHMALSYHKNDFAKLPEESKVMDALRKFNLPIGDYGMPWAGTSKDMKSTEYQENIKKGPRAILTILSKSSANMGIALGLWFLYSLVVSIFAAYITSRAVGAQAAYLQVFRFAGATAFIGYTMALWQNSIWFGRKWCTTFKQVLDGLIYALVTAGTFGWLWPA